ncbi:CDP-alcohol phosphatidyltransferase family protein [Clostridium formicaceticum]|nr:CDP-alcohol phosphatidyltransferase family protein [Clostridium formicaceticum]AOY78468.1 hypothetical protein BJL90_19375 [Clostridium formicaceticum]
MIDSKWRSKFQPLFDKMGKKLVTHNITPQAITWGAFVLGVVASIVVIQGWMLLSIALLWLSGLLDVLDGTVARLTRKSTKAGAYMDLILDRMVEAFYILAFAYKFPEGNYAYLLFYIAVIFNFTTFIVAATLFQNKGVKSIHYDVGIAERTETFIIFTLMGLFSYYIFPILMIFNVIIFITGIIRFKRVLNHCKLFD